MVAEAFGPGVVVPEAARRLGVDVSLLYRWRRSSWVTPSPVPGFLMIAATTGARLRVDGAFDPATLEAAVGALMGRAE